MSRTSVREWQDQIARAGTRLGFEPEPNTDFYSSVQSICSLPRTARTSLSPGCMFRDTRMMRDGDDNLSLVVSLAPAFNVWHRGREACLQRNEAIIFQADAPGRAGTRAGFSLIEISVTQTEWRLRHNHPGDALMRPIRRNSEALKLVRNYVGVLAKTGLPSSSAMREAVGRHLIDLVVMAATEPSLGESSAECVMAARRAAILDYIAFHHHEPDLSGSRVAEKLGISHRYLQRILEPTGKSFTEHVNNIRLDRAFALLTAKGATPRVLDIALQVGYSDLTHFYRQFRSRFGGPPKAAFKGDARPPNPAS
jgi:AraC-like DNA-binding protein